MKLTGVCVGSLLFAFAWTGTTLLLSGAGERLTGAGTELLLTGAGTELLLTGAGTELLCLLRLLGASSSESEDEL